MGSTRSVQKLMFTVTTFNGHDMILEDAGKDPDGHQLWRQIEVHAWGNDLAIPEPDPVPSRAEAIQKVIDRMKNGW